MTMRGDPWYERHKQRASERTRIKSREARAAGLCGVCRENAAAPGRYSCAECMEAARVRMRQRYAEGRR